MKWINKEILKKKEEFTYSMLRLMC